jgi:uncharacterized membrane protein YphA (DoxX/SURF4 family)
MNTDQSEIEISKFDAFYLKVRTNRWYRYFYILCRLVLAYAFIVAGMVKIVGERFASGLSVKHPMGAYLEALHHTGFYYTFIGYAQVLAAVMLLIPRTVTLGALLYLPVIFNIWLLSFAVRFEGSFITSPLMVLANLYILAWNYDRLRYILPFGKKDKSVLVQKPEKYSNKFPFAFFGMVTITAALTVLLLHFGFEAMPRNNLKDCKSQFVNTDMERAGYEFCECIHTSGSPLDDCLEQFELNRAESGR